MGATQRLLADLQLGRTLSDQGQGALTLAQQAVEQHAEQQAQQSAQQTDRQHCRGAVRLHERLARLNAQLEIVIGQAQQLIAGQGQGRDLILRIEHHDGAL
ncbi:hypothetical protein D3C79_1012570 [compost metagenome]